MFRLFALLGKTKHHLRIDKFPPKVEQALQLLLHTPFLVYLQQDQQQQDIFCRTMHFEHLSDIFPHMTKTSPDSVTLRVKVPVTDREKASRSGINTGRSRSHLLDATRHHLVSKVILTITDTDTFNVPAPSQNCVTENKVLFSTQSYAMLCTMRSHEKTWVRWRPKIKSAIRMCRPRYRILSIHRGRGVFLLTRPTPISPQMIFKQHSELPSAGFLDL